MSTVGADWADKLSALAAEHGTEIVDAPVMGSRPQAEEGKLVPLASGSPAARARSDHCSTPSRVTSCGSATTPGLGSRLKLVANHWILNSVENLAQTLAFAEALELDPRQLPRADLGCAVRHAVRPLEGRADARGRVPGRFRAQARAQGHATRARGGRHGRHRAGDGGCDRATPRPWHGARLRRGRQRCDIPGRPPRRTGS